MREFGLFNESLYYKIIKTDNDYIEAVLLTEEVNCVMMSKVRYKVGGTPEMDILECVHINSSVTNEEMIERAVDYARKLKGGEIDVESSNNAVHAP